ncbi:MAG: hypothetical protein Q8T11_06695 [Elusimicrobiota bacterium]|nr:hypothetical protein [Elusimicrobiota bacterium]
MRALLIAVYAVIAWYAARAVLRWLLQSPPKPERRGAGLPPDADMVRDPECGVYVLKDRAVTRIVRGSVLCFCSEACADKNEARGR